MIENKYVDGILDNDLYKLSMQNAVCFNYPRAVVRYNFINRGGREFPDGFAAELMKIIDTFRGFYLTKNQKDYIRMRCKYLNPVYIDFLNGYRYDPTEVVIRQEGSKLICHIEGPWYRTILWEVPLMATISQLYFEMAGKDEKLSRTERRQRNKEKGEALRQLQVRVAEFGTRRRESLENHHEVLVDMMEFMQETLIGTSNVKLAMDNNLKPIGTHAHEFFMFHAAKFGFRMANNIALKIWVKTYKGDLGIALPDTFTTDVFLQDFDKLYAKQFDGVRQDSGAPVDFMYKMKNHYESLGIDPITKTIVFSDAINNISLIKSITAACDGVIRDSYGIGTWFSNDVGLKPLNMVIKMSDCLIRDEWVPTIKLSDDEGKNTGDSKMVQLCKDTFRID